MDSFYLLIKEWSNLALLYFRVIPGSYYVVNYVEKSYQNDPVNILIEAFLIFFSIRYLTSKTYSPDKHRIELTEQVPTTSNLVVS
jgi:hypothetical protein